MKTMEEQLRRQETRIQGVMDSMATDKKSLEDRIESVNVELSNKLDVFMAAISQQFANLSRGNNEKGILGSLEVSNSRSSETLNQEQVERNGRNAFYTSVPKLEIPAFRGGNPREWIRKIRSISSSYTFPRINGWR